MEQRDYDHSELQKWWREYQEIEKAPLADRKEAAAEYGKALREYPQHVAETVNWLIAGSYGYGWYLKAGQVLESPRMNRVSALSQYAAAAEYRCPAVMARAEWLKLTPAQQQKVDGLVAEEIKDWEKEHAPKRASIPVKITPARPRRPTSPRLSR